MHDDEPMMLLKRDVLGRTFTPKARREALLDEFERSGLKGKRFARLAGIKYPTFAVWIQKRRRARGDYAAMAIASNASPSTPTPARTPRALRLVEALAAPSCAVAPADAHAAAAALEVLLPGGARLLVNHSAQVALAAQLLNSLRASC